MRHSEISLYRISGSICWTADSIQLEKVLKLHGNEQSVFNKLHMCSGEDPRMLQSVHAREKKTR